MPTGRGVRDRYISNWMRKLIIALYKKGYSTRQISSFVTLSHGIIYNRVIKGIARDKQTAAMLRQPPNTPKTRRTSHLQARNLVQEINGGIPLPTKIHVHHKDENPFNNDPSNLLKITASNHAKLHKPANPIPRHLRPERKKYMKKYLRKWRAENA